MKRLLFIVACLFMFGRVTAQNTFKALIRNDETNEPLKGATVAIAAINRAAVSDSAGIVVIPHIPNGHYIIEVSYIGFVNKEVKFTFPQPPTGQIPVISLEPQEDDLSGVTIQSTRTNQSLQDIPTRVEVLPSEELEEKDTEQPGDIKMLLGETTGILMQPTSAVSGSASFRIQGLDSRYTQLLQDGMPLYAGFSGSLSLLQVSPLNLKQVELIKGSASTLYGGGAIAGLVNLISKTPENKPELSVLLNGTSDKGFDGSTYYSEKWKHIGTTIFGSYDYNGAYDPSHQGFSAVPLTHRYTFNPKIFLYADDHNTGWFGVNITDENRLGGDMQVIAGHADSVHQYFERNKTFRFSTQFVFTHTIDSTRQINVKNTVGYFNRSLGEPNSLFQGTQWSSFTEVNYVENDKNASWVAGLNLVTDKFNALAPENILNYQQTTTGVFAQNTWKVNRWFSLESGLRADKNTPAPEHPANGVFILPRLNAMIKFNKHFTSRIGGGLGYKMPSVFNDESEEYGYDNIQPLNVSQTRAEQSYGLNADVNYRGAVGDAFLTVNQLFFDTRVNHALILQNNAFVNTPGFVSSHGAETNIILDMDELTFYLGYTYTDARLHNGSIIINQPLTPKHRVSFDSAYEIDNDYRIGFESFYTSSQLLSNGATGRGFITFGALAEKMWKHFDIFINSEDLTDRRQTRWAPLYTGSITHPVFGDIYTPLDGVVVNVGIRLKLLR